MDNYLVEKFKMDYTTPAYEWAEQLNRHNGDIMNIVTVEGGGKGVKMIFVAYKVRKESQLDQII